MVAQSRRQRLTLPVAPLAGALVGIMTAAMFALVPGDMLGRLILRTGIAAIIPAAEPPLGVTARLVLILMCGGGAALVSWFAVFLITGSRTIMFGSDAASTDDADPDQVAPVLRRADAHPDAPSRRPVFANRDLGTPFLDVRARHLVADDTPALDNDIAHPPLPLRREVLDLPGDLDQLLSVFDPGAMPPSVAPASPVPPPAPPRQQIFAPTERFETFELTPMVRPTPGDPVPPATEPRTPRDTQATIAALLERLERGVTTRADRAPVPDVSRMKRDEGLQETLVSLRRMATRD
ncbi:MAG: hypothetical protein B7Y43_08685 [Sphingomonas sp. 28-62-20]|uniref:hypothetical protein n=1 Tax=Sphingomonas sp. 28-62-20 TaxID=1970433 RepID=UPI000BDDEBE8|nr:MAG: hypothetical protein B7Y43_08685 [Sphingomonas sp. 28-62-20]